MSGLVADPPGQPDNKMHVTNVHPSSIEGRFEWDCTCGARCKVTYPNRPSAVRGADLHRALKALGW